MLIFNQFYALISSLKLFCSSVCVMKEFFERQTLFGKMSSSKTTSTHRTERLYVFYLINTIKGFMSFLK